MCGHREQNDGCAGMIICAFVFSFLTFIFCMHVVLPDIDKDHKNALVERGLAEYEIIDTKGNTVWHWKDHPEDTEILPKKEKNNGKQSSNIKTK